LTTPAVPVPESPICLGLDGSLLRMTRVAVRAPAAVGLKRTTIAHVSDGGT